MRKEASIKAHKDNSVFSNILKGALIALVVSLLLVLLFAFVLRFIPISDSLISPINQVIKGVSILIGAIFGLKKSKEMGLISGLIIGFLYTVLAFVTFAVLSGNFAFSAAVLNDLLFASIIGGISGIIAVNLKK